MSESYTYDWDGKDWQNFVLQLVRERHGSENVQRVPDKDRGDFGIECFTFDGSIYQCYAPEYPILISERTKKIKAKIHDDIGKLINYSESIKKFTGTITFNRWVLVVPLFDSKDVLPKCEIERSRVIQSSLSMIENDFRVAVCDQCDFSTEVEQLRRKGALRILINPLPIQDNQIQDWSESNFELAESMKEKLKRGFPNDPDPQIQKKVMLYVGWHIDRGNVLEHLRRDTPDAWDAIDAAIGNAERTLETLGNDSSSPREIIKKQMEELNKDISLCIPGLHNAEINKVAMGTVADWLMRCPLDFQSRSQ